MPEDHRDETPVPAPSVPLPVDVGEQIATALTAHSAAIRDAAALLAKELRAIAVALRQG